MPYYNVTFILQGPGGVVDAPNVGNPVQADDMPSFLRNLACNLPVMPESLGVRLAGMKIEEVFATPAEELRRKKPDVPAPPPPPPKKNFCPKCNCNRPGCCCEVR